MVVARIAGERFIVSHHATYEAALEAHAPLSEMQRHNRLARIVPAAVAGTAGQYMRGMLKGECAHGGQHVDAVRLQAWPGDYLAVRSADDPGWNTAPLAQLVVLGRGKGRASLENAIPLLPAALGSSVHGHAGGWVYVWDMAPGSARTHRLCRMLPFQGWHSWWLHTAYRHGYSHLVHVDGRWYAV